MIAVAVGSLVTGCAARPSWADGYVVSGSLRRGEYLGGETQVCVDARTHYAGYAGTKLVDCLAHTVILTDKRTGRERILYDLNLGLDAETTEELAQMGEIFLPHHSMNGPNLDIANPECGRFYVRDLVVDGRRYGAVIGILNEDQGGRLVPGYVGECTSR